MRDATTHTSGTAVARPPRAASPIDLSTLHFRYEPYPIGIGRPAIDPDRYARLLASWPPIELFEELPKVGHKRVLSEKYNGRGYTAFIERTPVWREFHRGVKSPAFIGAVLEALRAAGIDLGVRHPITGRRRLETTWRDLRRARWPRFDVPLRARFEFSALPATGGHVTPHTDSPGKVITLVISMERSWDKAIGGGTDVIRPLDPRRNFNWLNDKLEFDEIEVLDTIEFEPNQVIVFTKTFNSWHCVRPMTGTDPDLLRRTLTINIEEDD
jgi:hypothetical protein